MAPEQPSQDSSPPSNFNPSNILSELQGVLDQRFAAIDLGDRISRDTSKLIGSGTYGYVYGGTLNPNQTKVAVKSVRFGNKGALPVLKEVLKEVRNAFDYVQNTDVDLRPLILGIANGMYYLHTHEQGLIIHGDLKGPNVLVSDDGQALLNDFGFSHLSQASLSLAVEQHPGGTLNWMAPEYMEDEFTMTTAGDAFGMTTLELFTSKRPFDHLQHPCAIISHILRKERERPSPDVSCSRMTDEWWSICLLCWVRDPSQRAPMLNVVRNIRTIQTESKVVTQSLPCKVSSVRVNHLDDNASPGAWDPRNILNELVQRASRYCINLDGLVSKDHTGSRRLEGYAIISSGTLQLNEELMTRWTASSGFLKYGNTIKVAIKTSRGTLLEVVDVEAIMKFLKELHSWSKLNHENVLPLIGIATQFDYTLSIVSPWMKKGDARNFVRDKSVDPRPLIEGIASGLCYLHNCIPTPLYHEDVKGANVLISEDGRALLTDFGLSFLTDSTFSMSTPGRVGGSLPWIPPEMLDGGEASTAGDVWAFAMTALELFTRQDPFHPCRSIFAILTRITQGPPDRPRLEDTHGRLTKEWWSMCSECWHPDPFSRPTMLQVTTKIEQIMACNRTRDDGITMTSSLALEEFSMLASSYGLDIGAQIKRDESLSNPDLTTFTFRGKLRHSGERGTMALQSSLRSPKETMVVVKAIRDGPPLYRVLAKHMVDGVYALTTLRHENILPLLGLTTNFDGKVSLMSEWIERGDAHEYVQNGDVDPGPLLLGVANGLQYLHNHAPHPILHGALKGSNILISSDRQPLLTDFGLFDLIDPPLVNRLGTINWTSPECLLNPKGSAAGDVWAFAMTTLELFTRVLPFDSIRRPEELRRHIFRGPPDRLSNETTYERLTDGWWEICLLCWSKAK